MRVGLVLPGFSADEGDWCIPALLDMVRSLRAHCELFVLALRYPARRGHYRVYGATVQALGWGQRAATRKGLGWPDALAALLSEHRRAPFDLLHGFWASEAGLLAALAGRLLDRPALVSLAGGELAGLRDIGYGLQIQPRQRLLVRASLRLASQLTAGSVYLRALAEPHARRVPLATQPLGADCELFAPAEPAVRPHGAPRLLHVASLLPVKDQATLLKALALLRTWGCAATLDIVGEGPEEGRLRGLAASLGLAHLLRWRGPLPHHELPALYRAADAFVLTSRHEAQALVISESLACGTPVVATGVGVAPELLPASNVVPPQQPRALAEALQSLFSLPQRGRGLGLVGREQVQRGYSLEAAAKGWMALYDSHCL
jgi:glycosyltransferase involved in cell wall biosynthesis